MTTRLPWGVFLFVSMLVGCGSSEPEQAKVSGKVVHPTKAYFASCIARILSLKNSWSRNP